MTADRAPGRIPQELIGFFANKTPKPSFSYRDVWGDEHVHAFTVARVLEADLLETFRQAVIRAQAEGQPFEQFKREITPVLEQKGWFGEVGAKGPKAKSRRLETIYDTNLRMARAHGQWERIQRRKKSQPFLRYRLGPSEQHRPEHVVLDGLVYPADHPFWATHFPPNGHGCKCWVEQLTRTRTEDLGGVSPEFDEKLFPPQTYRDPRNGQVRTAPFGVQPGFEFRPGVRAGVEQALARRK